MNYKGCKELECYKQARELRIFIQILFRNFRPMKNSCLRHRLLIRQGL